MNKHVTFRYKLARLFHLISRKMHSLYIKLV